MEEPKKKRKPTVKGPHQKIPIEKVLQKIKENKNWVFAHDVYQGLAISKNSFYSWYALNGDERQQIDEALELNKTQTKQIIRDRLLVSKSPIALLALYRLLSTPEERKILNQKDLEIEAKKADNTIELVVS